MINYNVYEFSLRELIKFTLIWVGISFILAYVYFNCAFSMILMLPILPLYIGSNRKKAIIERKSKLLYEFCEMLESLCVALESGYSVENAFCEIEKEMQNVYGSESIIVQELHYINNNVRMGMNIEESLYDLAERCNIEEIKDYVDVFAISKRTDGNLIKVSEYTALIIKSNRETKQEIKTSITKRCNELKVMEIMPFGMMMYLKVSSPGFFDSVYDCTAGKLILLLLLIAYVIIYYSVMRITQKIEEGFETD